MALITVLFTILRKEFAKYDKPEKQLDVSEVV
jgi:hypothetical protein